MKIIKTANCKKVLGKRQKQAQTETINLLGRYIGDYLAAVERADNPNAYSERFWSDYYSEDYNKDESETMLLNNVPIELAEQLLTQGTSEQRFSDGYEAASAAAPYISKKEKETREEIPDTPMGLEDDNLVQGIDYSSSEKKIKTANYKVSQTNINKPLRYSEEGQRQEAEMKLAYPFNTLKERRDLILDRFKKDAIAKGRTEADEDDVKFANSILINSNKLIDNYGRSIPIEKVLQEKKERWGIECPLITKEELDQTLFTSI